MKNFNVDILAFGAHPDDVECAAAGVILSTIHKGGTVVLTDLTRGEMGSYGTVESRKEEALKAAKIMGIFNREQLDLCDGKIKNSIKNQEKVIELIRNYRPKIVLANAFTDRHPDHRKAAKLVSDACFLSGLKRNITKYNGKIQEQWRPLAVYHYIQDYFIQPHFVVDISDYFTTKMEVVKAYNTQFVTANDAHPNGTNALLDQIKATNQIFGRSINRRFAEGFVSQRYVGVEEITSLV
ncbi:bacillithiol biosynthesis deacetylase BshB1 [Arenibacter sp. GZD96]|uniref:bacillithiol biosynthesis deacetylase BshB1 n=1 Tax=Aurantibrevibacter litoralis TaxID=3106030 RepID=UPI002AFE55BC|nr:bacillithiol biosynthesis deacetylase BshB1 [Arenibacter sp. GZD-96]MEA1785449.1 bacillithiol biosynthesis deacetylase BshB1 [Arenibacter sp. GZD-96]